MSEPMIRLQNRSRSRSFCNEELAKGRDGLVGEDLTSS
jgi:hypothetical protein